MITWLPNDYLRVAGRLGLSRSPGTMSGSTMEDDLRHFVEQGVERVLCLQEAEEFGLMRQPHTLEIRRDSVIKMGMEFVHEPIVDMDVPKLKRTQRIVTELIECLESGKTVVVHCWAGLGRAGTIAACAMLQRGHDAQVAVALLRKVRPGAVQSLLQERHVREFAEAMRGGYSPNP